MQAVDIVGGQDQQVAFVFVIDRGEQEPRGCAPQAADFAAGAECDLVEYGLGDRQPRELQDEKLGCAVGCVLVLAGGFLRPAGFRWY